MKLGIKFISNCNIGYCYLPVEGGKGPLGQPFFISGLEEDLFHRNFEYTVRIKPTFLMYYSIPTGYDVRDTLKFKLSRTNRHPFFMAASSAGRGRRALWL